jgi:hypothetical protein
MINHKVATGMTAAIKRHKEKLQQQANLYYEVISEAEKRMWTPNKKVQVSQSPIRGAIMTTWLKEFECELYYVLEWKGFYLEPFRLCSIEAVSLEALRVASLDRWLAWRRIVAAELNEIEKQEKLS